MPFKLESPPRMRGKVIVRSRNAVQIGITPAYAGKRMLYARAVRRDRDHPRVCGEKVRRDAPAGGAVGSPPRMRGKAKELPPRQCYLGITPAYAGKSPAPVRLCWMLGDHPRVCGEKAGTDRPRKGDIGSPPRMRGKEASYYRDLDAYRITPAYAGKSLK